jgi:hypothetical protein
MPTEREIFETAVIQPLVLQHPQTGAQLSYAQYMELAEEIRSADEQPFVDNKFTPRLLTWLGYDEADWTYNQKVESERQTNRPDFMVRLHGNISFVVEDKNSTHDFAKEDAEQLRRYTAGTQGYALWTNGRVIRAFQFFPGGAYRSLADVSLEAPQLELDDQETAVALLRTLFSKRRFDSMPGILERICIPEDAWAQSVRLLDSAEAQQQFIGETGSLLTDLALAAHAQIDKAERDIVLARQDLETTSASLSTRAAALAALVFAEQSEQLRKRLDRLLANPLNVDEEALARLKPDALGAVGGRSWDEGVAHILVAVADYREREFARRQSREVHGSFQVWKERYRIIEGKDFTEAKRRHAYAEQVAYTFFVRLLLARILEDKKVVRRLISDGGLDGWRRITQPIAPATGSTVPALHGRALLDVLFRTVSQFYQHFFNQPVFDWYLPDDYFLAIALEKLSTFSFAGLSRDLLGFAYEAYVARAFRNAKGNFLTDPAIVDYILDEARYTGREIIGRTVLDPAVGSGSFLVQASQRLRAALVEAVEELSLSPEQKRRRVAEQFIERLQEDYVGLEINPFSCYLTELNLLLQVLDDLIYLWADQGEHTAVEQFRIYNTDSLTLSEAQLQNEPQLGEDESLRRDQAREVKLRGGQTFDYVVMNPPYINRAIEQTSRALTDIPFYQVIFGGGDANYYHAFIRLANYYVKPAGAVAVVVPLNLFGDKSSHGLRQWLSAPIGGGPPDGLTAQWTVNSLTRFYSRTTLFEDVLQGVCVICWQRLAAQGPYTVDVAGGHTIEEARHRRVTYSCERVLATDPISAGAPVSQLWYKAWPVVPEQQYLDVWERLRAATVTDLLGWTNGRAVFQQGDINITRTKPLRAVSEGGKVVTFESPIPTVGGKDVDDYADYCPSGQVDALAEVESMNLPDSKKREAEREREDRLERLLHLTAPESVCVLKDIVGLEPARPIRGALYRRGAGEPLVAFEHTLQIVYPTHPTHDLVVEACFGLLMSSVSNFITSLFSTNAHVTTTEVQRLPLPALTNGAIAELAAGAREVQNRGSRYASLKRSYGVGEGLMEIQPDPGAVLAHSGIETESLPLAVMRGHLTMGGSEQRRVRVLWQQQKLRPAAGFSAAYAEASELLARKIDDRYSGCTALLPTPTSAAQLLQRFEEAQNELAQARSDLVAALACLDRLVLRLYGIQDKESWALIGRGMPWATTMKEFANAVTDSLLALP